MHSLSITTQQRIDFVDITRQVVRVVDSSGIKDGLVTVVIPHTTCGVMINENCDPDVVRDIKFQLEKMVPYEQGYTHREGNADSHIKTSLIGSSETLLVENGKIVLGTWQGIFLCDFDGPRTRKVYLKVLES